MNLKQMMILFSLLMLGFGSMSNQLIAQEKEPQKEEPTGPVLKTLYQVPTTSVKAQGGTGTCWCFATNSMIESEILRLGKEEIGLSEMFTVRNVYSEKAEQYVRFHGTCNFEQGGAQHDVMTSMAEYGMVPREVYEGLNYGTKGHSHGEIVSVLKGMLNSITKNRNGALSPIWLKGFNAIQDAYFGEIPEEFEYKGKTYTPKSFAASLGINPADYVEFSSYTHHPFYEEFVLEVPDNWAQKSMYNVPIDELMEIINSAMEKEISISWAADVSDLNFAKGIGDVNNQEVKQADRQYLFDSYQLTDDHAMHLVGMATDETGKKYYMEKNSWGEGGKYKGYSYMTESFMRLRTMSIMVHKDAVPPTIAKKVGLK